MVDLDGRVVGGAASMEISADLGNWTPLGRSRLTGQDANGVQSMQVHIPPLTTDWLFLRIEGAAE